MHLDPAAVEVVARLVREGVQVEIGAELAVDPHQQVAVERRGHARGVVVGRQQRGQVLLQVDADDHRRRLAERGAHPPEERHRLLRPEIADRRSGKEADPVRAQPVVGQGDRLHEIGVDRHQPEIGKPGPHVPHRLGERAVVDVDRDPRRRLLERAQQDRRLAARAAAELDHAGPRADQRGHLAGVALQKADLGAGQVVFVEGRDLLEQRRAARIVEEPAGQRLLRPGEAVQHIGGEVRIVGLVALVWRPGVRSLRRPPPDAGP